MPPRRADHARLSSLEKLQRLRVARQEMALGDARETQREAERASEVARHNVHAREDVLCGLLNGESFAPEHYCLQAALLAAEQAVVQEAEARSYNADRIESERAASWNATRHQHQQLLRARHDMRRQLARKAEERELASAPFTFDSEQVRR